MDTLSLSRSNSTENLRRILFSMLQSAALESVLLAQKSLLSVLFMISQRGDISMVSDMTATDLGFPLGELNRVGKPAAENKDAGEMEEDDDSDDDDVDDDQDDDDDDSAGEEGSDDDDDDDDDEEDSDGEINGDGESDDDDDDDDDDDQEDDDDDEDDEELEEQPPSKRKK